MYQPDTHRSEKSLVLVTGAAGGLGKAFAVECASRGWDLFLTDLCAERLELLAAGLRASYGVRVITRASDLADPASRSALFERIRAEALRFWALINVAGVDYEGLFLEQTSQHIRSIIRLNVEGTIEMTHALLGFRDPLTTFRIINVASLAAFSPMPMKATYAASKRFLLDFSLALREEMRGLGATVTVLCPAGMSTTQECVAAIDAQGWIGQITTQDIGRVADQTLTAALAGQAVVIPGLVNRAVQKIASLLPVSWAVSLVSHRWGAVRQKRGLTKQSALTAS